MIVTIDIDGVVAEMRDCDFNPPLRTAKAYFAKATHPDLNKKILNNIIACHDVYFVSARSFEGAGRCTRDWLRTHMINVDACVGVICAEGGKNADWGTMSQLKHQVLSFVGSDLHIDDHPKVIEALPPDRACLFYNPAYEANVLAMAQGTYYKAYNWTQVLDALAHKEYLGA